MADASSQARVWCFMDSGPLSKGQIDGFIERGWTLLRHAFPPGVAQAVRRDIGRRIGIDLDRPEEWTQPQVWLRELLSESPYTDALTERFRSAVDQLVGIGRWEMTLQMGWWPISFPGFDDPTYGENWHIEGGWFHHHVWSPEQALLNLFCFSTVDAGGGGTRLIEGSHDLAARVLWEAEPDGLEANEFDEPLNAILDQKGWPGVVEVVAEEGDVVLAHPLLFHSSNPNHGTRPRVMAQPAFSMTQPKRVEGDSLGPESSGNAVRRLNGSRAFRAVSALSWRLSEHILSSRVSHSGLVAVPRRCTVVVAFYSEGSRSGVSVLPAVNRQAGLSTDRAVGRRRRAGLRGFRRASPQKSIGSMTFSAHAIASVGRTPSERRQAHG